MALRRRTNPDTLLIVAMVAAAVLLIALGWQLTFFQDTWAVLLERQPWNAHSLLYPHNEHLIVFQAIVEKGFVEIFGMRNAHPEMLFMTATLLASAALVYVYVKRRLGGWVALLIAVLLLFFGEAWEILLWPFEMEFSAPFAAGMGMLLILEREDRRGDIWGAVLLVVAVGFGSLGVSFIFAAFAQIAVAARERGWKRLWIVAVPAVLYLAWYAKYGHDAEHHITLDNILNAPAYVFEGVGAGFASVLGLANAPLTGVVRTLPLGAGAGDRRDRPRDLGADPPARAAADLLADSRRRGELLAARLLQLHPRPRSELRPLRLRRRRLRPADRRGAVRRTGDPPRQEGHLGGGGDPRAGARTEHRQAPRRLRVPQGTDDAHSHRHRRDGHRLPRRCRPNSF